MSAIRIRSVGFLVLLARRAAKPRAVFFSASDPFRASIDLTSHSYIQGSAALP